MLRLDFSKHAVLAPFENDELLFLIINELAKPIVKDKIILFWTTLK